MTRASVVVAIVVAFGLMLLANVLYVINEKERAVVLRFGELVQVDVQPGLHFKWPFIDRVRTFDGRVLTLDSPPQRYLTAEKKYLIVDSFVKWRIRNVADYYRSTSGDEGRLNRLLGQRVDAGLRNQFAERTVREVVSGERDKLMSELFDDLNQVMGPRVGVEVVDVRVKKIDLPKDVSESVYSRMRTKRELEAQKLRSEGREIAALTRAQADRERVEILASAYRESQIIRGEGDARATVVYARAFGSDKEFYSFTRSLRAYRETFKSKGDLLVIDPKSDFFRYLKASQKTN